jgi:transcription elongation GreA/GreB family factor
VSKKIETQAFYVLEEDKQWARQRIAELEKAIQELGPEFNVALTQSNETWHDNAPFDALRDTQALYVAEMQHLKEVLAKAAIKVPKRIAGMINIGNVVTLKRAGKHQRFLLAGHWTYRVAEEHDGATIVSCMSPLGSALLGAKVGDEIIIPTTKKRVGDVFAIE